MDKEYNKDIFTMLEKEKLIEQVFEENQYLVSKIVAYIKKNGTYDENIIPRLQVDMFLSTPCKSSGIKEMSKTISQLNDDSIYWWLKYEFGINIDDYFGNLKPKEALEAMKLLLKLTNFVLQKLA